MNRRENPKGSNNSFKIGLSEDRGSLK